MTQITDNNKPIKLASKKFKTMDIKGKQYVEVKERILYLANDFEGDYSIETDYQYFPEQKLWVVKARLTLIQGDNKVTYTGLGQEIESAKYGSVNSTSALENAETSAVGRACAFAGIGIVDGIASVDEINKATNRAQDKRLDAKVNEYVENNPPTPANKIEPIDDATKKKWANLFSLCKTTDDVKGVYEKEKLGIPAKWQEQFKEFTIDIGKGKPKQTAQTIPGIDSGFYEPSGWVGT